MAITPMNDRCPLQREGERKRCECLHHERDCPYYHSNARPGAEIEDQGETQETDWESSALAELEKAADEPAPKPPASKNRIADNILDILGKCRTEGNTLFLPEGQLDRATYQAVNKVLESIGGKWNRKAKGHIFADGDPAELLDNVILAGEITDLKKQNQFFPTPRPIAERMCELAELDDTCIVLEPECGKGDLADVIHEAGVKELVGLELNRDMEKHLSGKPYATLTGIDFLEFVKDPGIKTPWTRIVMNPPFSRQQDIDHILTAYSILRPGGILVSVVSESPFFRTNKKSVEFREFLEAHEAVIEPVAEGAFKESGTMVRTRLVKIVKPTVGEISVEDTESVPEAQPAAEAESTEEAPAKISQLMTQLPVDKLFPHPDNPRKDLGDLTELADSIKANGIFQNLTVVPADDSYETFTVVIGHRRLAAAKLAGLSEVPCVITEMDQKEQVRTMLLENMQRSDLTVYEQAQGFQMMLDLGSTIEEIAEKSGFSKTTVRRRVKMMELDQGTLKEVSERQLSLTDFDQLAQIEDIKARNECLTKIGTSDFNRSVEAEVRRQTVKKNLPAVKKLLKAAKAKAIKQNDTYSNKYERVGAYSYYIADWKEGEPLIPEKVSGQLYYHLEEGYGTIQFFQERKKAPPVKRPKEQIEKEKRIAAAWNSLEEKAAVAYNLRAAFIKDFPWGKKSAEPILRGALIAGVLKTIDYMSSDRDGMEKALGLEERAAYGSERGKKALAAFQNLDVKQIPNVIYAMFDDSAKENWASGYRGAYPAHQASTKLDGLYTWLTALGYVMSDEEKALQDGTHELYHRQEAEEKAKAPSEEGTAGKEDVL